MADNPKKRGKQDRARVALGQEHEREYLIHLLADAEDALASLASQQLVVRGRLLAAIDRLRSGFPAAQKKARRKR